MNGNVFQCFNKCEEKKQFSKTVQALGEYIVKNLKYPGDMMLLCKTMVKPTIPKPEDLDESEKSRLKIPLWEKRVAAYCSCVDYIKSNLKSMYAVIWGQCSKAMKAKLTSLGDFDSNKDNSNRIWLLKEINGASMYRFEGQRYVFLSLHDARANYHSYKQGQEQTTADYLEQFRSHVDLLERYGGNIVEDQVLLDAIADKVGVAPLNTVKETSWNHVLALAFLRGADWSCFSILWTDLENQYSCGPNQYPVDPSPTASL